VSAARLFTRDIEVSRAREMLSVTKDEEEVPLMSATPSRRRYEASEISGILAFQKYSVAAQAGAIASSLGPLLALSLMAVRTGLSGEEIASVVQAMAEALAVHGHRQAARELLEGAIRGFVAGGDHQAAADLAELLAFSTYTALGAS
jgi:hypothetical protein